MIKSFLFAGMKITAYFVLWVFILSISWDGKTLFERAHNLVVQNSVVQALDEELAYMWERVNRAVDAGLAKSDQPLKDETEF